MKFLATPLLPNYARHLYLSVSIGADQPAGHEAQHERQHIPEAVQDAQRSDRRAGQTRRRPTDGSREAERTCQDLAGQGRGNEPKYPTRQK